MYDFNNDGILDFATGNVTHDTVNFGLSEKEKAFAKRYYTRSPLRPETYYPGISYDLNNDGRVDLIYGGIREPAPLGFVSFQNITQVSARISQFLETQVETFGFYGNDFDGDNCIDYIIVGGGPGRNIQYRNNGKGILEPHGLQVDSTDLVRLRETVTGGDWDGDGDIDLTFANSILKGPFTTDPDVCIYLNDGQGTYSFARRIPLNFNRYISRKLEAADLDRDGDLDVIGLGDGLFYIIANGGFATGVSTERIDRPPAHFSLRSSYPNPFARETRFEIIMTGKERRKIMVTIFDLTGRTVKTWQIDNPQSPLEMVWDGPDQQGQLVPNGLYFLNVRVGNNSVSQKLMVLR
jgi:hypothetical protein